MREQQSVAPVSVFYSYAHEDKALREQLEKHLNLLRRQGLILEWHDSEIPPGAEWAGEIDAHLQTASIILLLISADFLASDYCYDKEMTRALERHQQRETQVIPIILRPCDWKTSPFAHLEYLPRDGKAVTEWRNQDTAFSEIARELRECILKRQPLPPGLSVTQRKPLSFFYRALYAKTYYRGLLQICRPIDLTGLNTPVALALEQIFVELSIAHTPPQNASTDPFSTKDRSERHPIGDYLKAKGLASPHFVIVGAPGSGKTTLLKSLALHLVAPKKLKSSSPRSYRIPIFLSLRDHQDEINSTESFSLVDAVGNQCRRAHKLFLRQWFEQQLSRGHCLVLLDGLDEVADTEKRKKVTRWIREQMEHYDRNRFILTSRPFGYQDEDNPLHGLVTVLEIQPLSPDQKNDYIQRWYKANEILLARRDCRKVRENAQRKADDLLARLRTSPSLLKMSFNPLLLSMIATVHEYGEPLPTQRWKLYAEICHMFLEKRSQTRGLSSRFARGQVQQILQRLAYTMMCQEQRDISLQDICQAITQPLHQMNPDISVEVFLGLVEGASGLFLKQGDNSYRFAHLTLQEFLAAVYIKEEGMEHILFDKLTSSWWRETIRLYCAQADATALVRACLAMSPLTVEALVLAFECNEEKPKLQPELNAIIEDDNLERRRLAAEALLLRRLNQMIDLQQDKYIDTSLVTCAEYQLFLDEQRVQGNYSQPDHWTEYSFPKGSGNAPILGVRRIDAQAFCDWLTARDRKGWHYRLPRREEWVCTEQEQYKEKEIGYWTETDFRWVWGEVPTFFKQCLLSVYNSINNLASTFKFLDKNSAIGFARMLGAAMTRAYILDIDSIFGHISNLERDLECDLAYIQSASGSRSSSLFNIGAFFSYDATQEYVISVKDLTLLITKAKAIALACNLARDLASNSGTPITQACQIAQELIQELVHIRKVVWDEPIAFHNSGGVDDSQYHLSRRQKELDKHIHFALDLYIRLLFLEKRVEGNFPAYEGILLVKERQQRGGRYEA